MCKVESNSVCQFCGALIFTNSLPICGDCKKADGLIHDSLMAFKQLLWVMHEDGKLNNARLFKLEIKNGNFDSIAQTINVPKLVNELTKQ